jgi:phosphoglycolate phosphatase
MTKPLLVFDLDGTLADTAPDLIATLDFVLPRYGFERPTAADFREGVGHGARVLIEYALKVQGAAVDTQTIDAIQSDYLAYYEANICVETQLFPGALALLDRFEAEGWGFAVCTNKPERMSELLLSRLGVKERFAAIKGGDSYPYRKPDPAHLLDTIAAAGGVCDRAIFIGDSRTDLDTARNARVPLIGVTFGYTPVPMAALLPDLLVDSFDEILPLEAERLLNGADRAARPTRTPAPAAP